MAAPGPSSRLMRGTRNSTLSKPAISVTRSAKTTAGSAMSYAAPQTKSMRALGKENEGLQLQLKEMAESIKASNEAKCLIRTSSERIVKKKEEEIEELRAQIENLKEVCEQERELRDEETARAAEAEDARFLADDSREQDKEDMAYKLQSTSKSLDDCQRRLEAAGINAVSLKDWIAREGGQDEDMIMLENQLSDAMGLLKGHKASLRERINSVKKTREDIAKSSAELQAMAKEPEVQVSEEEVEGDEENEEGDTSLESIEEEEEEAEEEVATPEEGRGYMPMQGEEEEEEEDEEVALKEEKGYMPVQGKEEGVPVKVFDHGDSSPPHGVLEGEDEASLLNEEFNGQIEDENSFVALEEDEMAVDPCENSIRQTLEANEDVGIATLEASEQAINDDVEEQHISVPEPTDSSLFHDSVKVAHAHVKQLENVMEPQSADPAVGVHEQSAEQEPADSADEMLKQNAEDKSADFAVEVLHQVAGTEPFDLADAPMKMEEKVMDKQFADATVKLIEGVAEAKSVEVAGVQSADPVDTLAQESEEIAIAKAADVSRKLLELVCQKAVPEMAGNAVESPMKFAEIQEQHEILDQIEEQVDGLVIRNGAAVDLVVLVDSAQDGSEMEMETLEEGLVMDCVAATLLVESTQKDDAMEVTKEQAQMGEFVIMETIAQVESVAKDESTPEDSEMKMKEGEQEIDQNSDEAPLVCAMAASEVLAARGDNASEKARVQSAMVAQEVTLWKALQVKAKDESEKDDSVDASVQQDGTSVQIAESQAAEKCPDSEVSKEAEDAEATFADGIEVYSEAVPETHMASDSADEDLDKEQSPVVEAVERDVAAIQESQILPSRSDSKQNLRQDIVREKPAPDSEELIADLGYTCSDQTDAAEQPVDKRQVASGSHEEIAAQGSASSTEIYAPEAFEFVGEIAPVQVEQTLFDGLDDALQLKFDGAIEEICEEGQEAVEEKCEEGQEAVEDEQTDIMAYACAVVGHEEQIVTGEEEFQGRVRYNQEKVCMDAEQQGSHEQGVDEEEIRQEKGGEHSKVDIRMTVSSLIDKEDLPAQASLEPRSNQWHSKDDVNWGEDEAQELLAESKRCSFDSALC